MKPRLLDLYCGAGGATRGYQRAGFHVTGVDSRPQPHYCGDAFVQADVMTQISLYWMSDFDAIHASPPCQRWSKGTKPTGNPEEHPDLITPTRWMLKKIDRPYIIENVPGAPLEDYITLCGASFADLRVIRHRRFECNFFVMAPPHQRHPDVWHYRGRREQGIEHVPVVSYVSLAGNQAPADDARDAMGIDWMSLNELDQAIPPAYTHHIGKFLMAFLRGQEEVSGG